MCHRGLLNISSSFFTDLLLPENRRLSFPSSPFYNNLRFTNIYIYDGSVQSVRRSGSDGNDGQKSVLFLASAFLFAIDFSNQRPESRSDLIETKDFLLFLPKFGPFFFFSFLLFQKKQPADLKFSGSESGGLALVGSMAPFTWQLLGTTRHTWPQLIGGHTLI